MSDLHSNDCSPDSPSCFTQMGTEPTVGTRSGHRPVTRLLSVREVCALTGLGRTSLYQELRSGRLRSLRIGGRRLVPADALEAWIDVALDADQWAR